MTDRKTEAAAPKLTTHELMDIARKANRALHQRPGMPPARWPAHADHSRGHVRIRIRGTESALYRLLAVLGPVGLTADWLPTDAAPKDYRSLRDDGDWFARITPLVTVCDCTTPYSSHVEGPGASNVDAYGQPLQGARRVYRCRHGHEMRWDGRRYRAIQERPAR